MRLTRKKAIEIAIELWTWLAETGARRKSAWKGWEKHGEMWGDCPLCEYSHRHGDDECESCPYFQRFGDCIESETPYRNWESAEDETKAERKKYASEFLQQLRGLK